MSLFFFAFFLNASKLSEKDYYLKKKVDNI